MRHGRSDWKCKTWKMRNLVNDGQSPRAWKCRILVLYAGFWSCIFQPWDLVRHFPALLFQSLFFFGPPFSGPANSAPHLDTFRQLLKTYHFLVLVHGVSIKMAHFVFAHTFDVCQPISTFYGRYTAQEICKKVVYSMRRKRPLKQISLFSV